jgi:hypothetical protein
MVGRQLLSIHRETPCLEWFRMDDERMYEVFQGKCTEYLKHMYGGMQEPSCFVKKMECLHRFQVSWFPFSLTIRIRMPFER